MIYLTTETETNIRIIPTIDLITRGDIYIKFTDCISKQDYLIYVTTVSREGDITKLYTDELGFQLEDRFYDILVYIDNTGETVYKDKVYCTNQDLNNFTINEGEYTLPNVGDNSYIVL